MNSHERLSRQRVYQHGNTFTPSVAQQTDVVFDSLHTNITAFYISIHQGIIVNNLPPAVTTLNSKLLIEALSMYPNPIYTSDAFSNPVPSRSQILRLFPDIYSIRVFLDITNHVIPQIIPFPGRDSENQVVQTLTSENIHVIPGVWATARTEAVGFVGHFVDLDLDTSWVVPVHVPALVTHVSHREQIDGAIAFPKDDAVVDIVLC